MNIDREGVEIDTKRVHDRRFKRNSNEFKDGELSIEALPVQSINDTDLMYDLNNSTLGNHTNTDTNTYSESDVFWTVVGPVLMVILCVFNTRSHVPSSQYHRGAMIRRQAERVWAIERVKTERQGVPIETRKTQINDNLRKMKVVSKCASTGHCILGTVEVEEHIISNDSGDEGTIEAISTTGKCSTDSEDIEAISDSSSTANEGEEPLSPASTTDAVASFVVPVPVAAASPKSESKCPESPGKAERRPLLSTDSEDSAENPGSVTETKEVVQSPPNNCCATTATPSSYDDFDDDEDVCPICLDNFEVGDIVMFSRHNHSSCSHVFHEDCLLQWLLEQRENDCPTCRACFISDHATDSSSASTTDTDENSSSLSDEPEDSSTNDESIVDEISGDIEEGKTISASSDITCNEDNSGGDCIGDCSGGTAKARDNDHKFVNGEEENDSLKIDVLDEMEQGFTYVIIKGSVQRIPS
jgi:hypothetical protein